MEWNMLLGLTASVLAGGTVLACKINISVLNMLVRYITLVKIGSAKWRRAIQGAVVNRDIYLRSTISPRMFT